MLQCMSLIMIRHRTPNPARSRFPQWRIYNYRQKFAGLGCLWRWSQGDQIEMVLCWTRTAKADENIWVERCRGYTCQTGGDSKHIQSSKITPRFRIVLLIFFRHRHHPKGSAWLTRFQTRQHRKEMTAVGRKRIFWLKVVSLYMIRDSLVCCVQSKHNWPQNRALGYSKRKRNW